MRSGLFTLLERLAENGEDRTVNIFTVSFFGHRIIPEFREAEDRVEALVHALLLEKEYVEFLVGRDGDFDQIVSSAVKRQYCHIPRRSYTTIRKTLKPIMMKSKYAAARPAATRKVLFKFATGRW